MPQTNLIQYDETKDDNFSHLVEVSSSTKEAFDISISRIASVKSSFSTRSAKRRRACKVIIHHAILVWEHILRNKDDFNRQTPLPGSTLQDNSWLFWYWLYHICGSDWPDKN